MSNSVGSSSPRFAALETAGNRKSRQCDWATDSVKLVELFGSNTFSNKNMKEKLPKKTYNQLQSIVKQGAKLDKTTADEVAKAVKDWAVEKGVTHFTHLFQPLTGLTAEKHDAFLSFDEDGLPIERISGSQLMQAEPDASSFPSGGLRATHAARGYTVWDPSSPIFIMEKPNGKTLYIPSVFISYDGRSLDQKGPLLRSMEILSSRALAMLKLFGNTTATRVTPSVGVEQEYFLIDQAFYNLRPDLVAAGRTVVGAKSPKGQELEDHYFGVIPERVQSFMQEVEYELYRLGIPVKTRHNEVAPAQFETAPIFEGANLAADHNQQTMETLRAVARLHGLVCLLHEKPFAGINGSGKHNNWSFSDSDGNNLLDPGKTPAQNLQFLVFLTATLKGLQKRAGLLRAAIASSGNDFRLGANEAPPAIISAFLGEQLDAVLNAVENGTLDAEISEERIISLGISHIPEVQRDYTDRNRTSPFAFTGNKFEFRAVASSASISTPMTYLNAAVAEALEEMHGVISGRVSDGIEFKKAVLETVREAVIETKAIRYEGNGYAQEWVEEALRLGLPNLRKSPEALAELVKPESLKFFSRLGLFGEEEVQARYHVQLERYIKECNIEVEALQDLVKTQILPAAYQQQELLASSISSLMSALKLGPESEPAKTQLAQLQQCATGIAALNSGLAALTAKMAELHHLDDLAKEASFMAEEILPLMLETRQVCDGLEETIADYLWPLPKYREMLFIS